MTDQIFKGLFRRKESNFVMAPEDRRRTELIITHESGGICRVPWIYCSMGHGGL